MNSILLFGGTGQVGSLVAKALLAQGAKPRVLSRSEEKIARLPPGVEGCSGDLDRPETLVPALEGAEAALLLLANEPREMHRALTALAAIESSGVKRLVYLSNHLSRAAPQVPHAGAKLAVEAAIKRSALAYTILQPSFFAQNDAVGHAALLGGLYPHPIGLRKVPRVDVRDIATAAAEALTGGKGEGAVFPLSSPDAPNGPESAALWSAALGREVRYPGDDLTAWAESVEGHLPAWFIGDLVLMYRHLQEKGQAITDPELALQEELLGRPPLRYEAYIRECAAAWTP